MGPPPIPAVEGSSSRIATRAVPVDAQSRDIPVGADTGFPKPAQKEAVLEKEDSTPSQSSAAEQEQVNGSDEPAEEEEMPVRGGSKAAAVPAVAPAGPPSEPASRQHVGQREIDSIVIDAISRGDVRPLKRALATAELGVNDVVDVSTGFTALHTAAAYGKEDIAFFLVDDAGADTLARDAGGRRAAEVAERCGHAGLAADLASFLRAQQPLEPPAPRSRGRSAEPEAPDVVWYKDPAGGYERVHVPPDQYYHVTQPPPRSRGPAAVVGEQSELVYARGLHHPPDLAGVSHVREPSGAAPHSPRHPDLGFHTHPQGPPSGGEGGLSTRGEEARQRRREWRGEREEQAAAAEARDRMPLYPAPPRSSQREPRWQHVLTAPPPA